jgi:TPR repeat protein
VLKTVIESGGAHAPAFGYDMWILLLLLAISTSAYSATYESTSLALTALRLDLRQGWFAEPFKVSDRYREACLAGYDPACDPSPWRVQGVGDLQAARRFFAPLCDQGDPVACVVAGWGATQNAPGGGLIPGPLGAKGANEGLALFTRACDLGLTEGCVQLGRLYVIGVGTEKNFSHAFSLFSDACDAGNVSACSSLGSLYEAGLGVARNRSTAGRSHLNVPFIRQLL